MASLFQKYKQNKSMLCLCVTSEMYTWSGFHDGPHHHMKDNINDIQEMKAIFYISKSVVCGQVHRHMFSK